METVRVFRPADRAGSSRGNEIQIPIALSQIFCVESTPSCNNFFKVNSDF